MASAFLLSLKTNASRYMLVDNLWIYAQGLMHIWSKLMPLVTLVSFKHSPTRGNISSYVVCLFVFMNTNISSYVVCLFLTPNMASKHWKVHIAPLNVNVSGHIRIPTFKYLYIYNICAEVSLFTSKNILARCFKNNIQCKTSFLHIYNLSLMSIIYI